MAQISETSIQTLEQLYILKNPDVVLAYLETEPFLVPLLIEVRQQIRRYFADSSAVLEVFDYQDDTIAERQLYLSIMTQLPVDEALDRLNQFDTNWWLDKARRTQRKVSIDVDFQ